MEQVRPLQENWEEMYDKMLESGEVTLPDKDKVREWKRQFPVGVFITICADGSTITWRGLNRREWKKFRATIPDGTPEDEQEDALMAAIILDPAGMDIGEMAPGKIESVCREFLLAMGFSMQVQTVIL